MLDSYLTELKTLRNWTQKAEKELQSISTFGLPIVSPMRDLALPGSLIYKEFSKFYVPEDPKELVTWNQHNKDEQSLNHVSKILTEEPKLFFDKVSSYSFSMN